MKYLLLFLALVLMVPIIGITQTSDVLLEWEAPTTREDGSELLASEIASYELSVQGGGFVASVAESTYLLANFSIAGNPCFEVRTKDTSGRISDAAVACIKARPAKVSIFRAIVQ